MKLIAALMCTVAGPDHNPTGGGQLPYPNECNSMLMSATRGIYPFPLYIDFDEWKPSKIWVTAYVFSTRPIEVLAFEVLVFDFLKFFIFQIFNTF